jgi:hypothetical protein
VLDVRLLPPVEGCLAATVCPECLFDRYCNFTGVSQMSEVKRARAVGFNHVALEVSDIEEALAFDEQLSASIVGGIKRLDVTHVQNADGGVWANLSLPRSFPFVRGGERRLIVASGVAK